MIMSGTRTGVVHTVQLVDIHGTHFYDLVYTHEGEATPRQARVGLEACYQDPRPGDAVTVAYLMNIVTGVSRRGD
jgi:hypothetical protein